MKNKGGFTLVELLAVIAILAILATISVVSVEGVLKNSKKNANKIQEESLVSAAKAYAVDNLNDCKDGCSVSFSNLISEGYIDEIGDTDNPVGSVILSRSGNKFITYINYNSLMYSCVRKVQTFTAPSAGYYILEVWGAQGGGVSLSNNTNSGDGGKGGYAKGKVYLNANATLYIYVGCAGESSSAGIALGGFNGGGSAWASSDVEPANGGGGATDIRVGTDSLNYRIIVAGGGGGGGEDPGETGGAGGGASGTSSFPGTQETSSGGAAFGQGAHTPNDGGAGGGGWFGGGTTNGSQTVPTANSSSDTSASASGGSGYVFTSSSYKPTGYNPSNSYYLTETVLKAGTDSTIPNPKGTGNITGNSGDGYAKITKQ